LSVLKEEGNNSCKLTGETYQKVRNLWNEKYPTWQKDGDALYVKFQRLCSKKYSTGDGPIDELKDAVAEYKCLVEDRAGEKRASRNTSRHAIAHDAGKAFTPRHQSDYAKTITKRRSPADGAGAIDMDNVGRAGANLQMIAGLAMSAASQESAYCQMLMTNAMITGQPVIMPERIDIAAAALSMARSINESLVAERRAASRAGAEPAESPSVQRSPDEASLANMSPVADSSDADHPSSRSSGCADRPVPSARRSPKGKEKAPRSLS